MWGTPPLPSSLLCGTIFESVTIISSPSSLLKSLIEGFKRTIFSVSFVRPIPHLESNERIHKTEYCYCCCFVLFNSVDRFYFSHLMLQSYFLLYYSFPYLRSLYSNLVLFSFFGYYRVNKDRLEGSEFHSFPWSSPTPPYARRLQHMPQGHVGIHKTPPC